MESVVEVVRTVVCADHASWFIPGMVADAHVSDAWTCDYLSVQPARYRKSATAAPSVTNVPVALPSSIFDFVRPVRAPAGPPRSMCSRDTLDGRTP